MSILFRPAQINRCQISNRIVRSATYDAGADENGTPTSQQVQLFEKLAMGEVGLIFTGISSVIFNGQIQPYQIRLDSRKNIPNLKKLTGSVHENGAKVVVQVGHGGRVSAHFHKDPKFVLVPSPLKDNSQFNDNYSVISEKQIKEIVDAFGQSALFAKEAGFDGVQIHGAHGFLLSQFLSPVTNNRKDSWGGPLENRLRIHREIYRAMRREVGSEFPIMIKLGVRDDFDGGLGLSEGKEAARTLAELGYDSIEVSIGLRGKEFEETEFKTNINTKDQEAYFRDLSREVKQVVKVPVMAVGGFRSLELMEETLNSNDADFISMCRPLIREPELVKYLKSNERRKASCISCNKCLEGVRNKKFLKCYQI